MKAIVIADPAKDDLKEVAQYTQRLWGAQQKGRYLAAITERMNALARGATRGRRRDDISPGCHTLTAGSHVIVYIETEDAIQIRRILHQRMDLPRHVIEDPGSIG